MLSNLKEYFYEMDLTWNSERRGTLHFISIPKMDVVASSDFLNGEKDKWTPEHMLGGAVSSCFMNTFLALAEKSGLSVLAYESHCFIKLEKVDGKLEASEILIRPTITLAGFQHLSKAIQIAEKAENESPLKKALKLNIEIHPDFEYFNLEEKVEV